jgi:biopolymer transport protein ExbD/biopolymer transport protein TolR
MATPNVIPMADIMLVLLIIFMVVTPMLQKGAAVDRAMVNNPRDMQAADKEDAILVAITHDGTIYVGSTIVDKSMLKSTVKEKLASSSEKTVFVNSDRRAKYGDVVAAIDEIRSAGVDQLGLLTEKVGGPKSGPPKPPPTGN